MKFDVILQARSLSTRLPGKMFLELGHFTVVEYLIRNLKKIRLIDKICLAVPDDEFSELFLKLAKKNKIKFFVAKNVKENDLLSRFYLCAKKFKSQNILRITPDCPFINIYMINLMIEQYRKNALLYLTNNKPKRFVPHGFDCEIFNISLLREAYKKTKNYYDKEHVTPWIYKNYFKKKKNFIKIFDKDYSNLRVTLDYFSDYYFFKKNFRHLSKLSLSKKPETIINKLI